MEQKQHGSSPSSSKNTTGLESQHEESVLFNILRRRHACRDFDKTLVIPDEILLKLVYAGHRASTGSNIPYRFLIVVKDPVQIKMMKLVSPGFYGDPFAVFVICTDTRKAPVGRGCRPDLSCAEYDAGAAAENIVLAAYSMGLGASFVKSYCESAMAKILDLPQGCRTELIIPIGHPSKDEPAPLKKRPGAKLTYLDKFPKPFGQRTKIQTSFNRSL
jgi:nitroreductase